MPFNYLSYNSGVAPRRASLLGQRLLRQLRHLAPSTVAAMTRQSMHFSCLSTKKSATQGALLLLGSLALAAPAAHAQTFLRSDHEAEPNPAGVIVADLNSDGKADLVSANYYSRNVSVLLGKGDGTFAPKVNYATNDMPISVATSDLNGDGKTDLVVANYASNNVSVMLGRGDGTFGSKIDFTTGITPIIVSTNDLNGDGRNDLVIANINADTISVLLNRGGGSFAPKVDYSAAALPASIVVSDFNGDARPDIVAANLAGDNVSVLMNKGNGTFAAKVNYATGVGPRGVAFGDFNSDGKSDLVTANVNGDTVSVLFGRGNGTFAPHVDYSVGPGPISVAVGDFNNDGKADLVVANLDGNTVSLLLNKGDGTFSSPVDYAVGPRPIHIAVGDFNNDGRTDIVTANNDDNTLTVLLNTPTLSIGNAVVKEGNSGTTLLSFPVTLNFAIKKDVKVSYSTSDGTATAGSDYNATSGTLTIPAGQTTGTITIEVRGDTTIEPDETFNVTLSAAQYAKLGTANATGTIENDDFNSAPTAIALDPTSIPENKAVATPIGTLSTTDPDANNTFTYTLVEGKGNNSSFSIDGNTLKAGESFDFETKNTYTVVVRSTDQGGLFFDQTFTINVLDVNEAPSVALVNTIPTLSEDADTTNAIKVADIVVTDDALGTNTLIVSGDDAAFFEIKGNSLYLKAGVSLDFGAKKTYSVSVDVDDADLGAGPEGSAPYMLNITDVNHAPVASDVVATTDEDQPTTVSAKATDKDGDSLQVTQVSQGAHGTVVINPDGTITYTPNADYNGTDSFTYKVSDGKLDSNVATVTVTVKPINDAPVANDDLASTDEDQTVTINAKANDTDADGDSLQVTQITQGAHGTVAINSDGTVTYTPNADYTGTDFFTYKVSDGKVESNAATITVKVNAVNDAPVASNDTTATDEDKPVTITPKASDADGDSLQVTQVSQGAHGTVAINPDGTITYTPNADYNGTDSFTYKVNDGKLDSNTATITVTVRPVNDAPVANNDSTTTDENKPVTVSPKATDKDGDSLQVTQVSQGAHGSVVINPDGTITYKPNANYNGLDSFTYKVSDGKLDSNVATVTVTVNPVNDAPVANDDKATVDEDQSVTINAKANDTDADGDTLKVTQVSQGAHGTVVINSDGTITYTPAPDYNGTDSFTYKVSDGTVESNTATVSVTVKPVNDSPVANNDSTSTDENQSVTVSAKATDKDGDSLKVTQVTQGTYGTVAINPDGTMTYTPDANYNGTDSFTYKVSDGKLDSNFATITVTVKPVNDAPVANDDVATVDEDQSVIINAKANDSDVDGDSLQVTQVTQGAHGSVVINPDGTITYKPAANYNGNDSFTYKVSDGKLSSDWATVAVTVNPVNDAPVAVNDTGAAACGKPITLSVKDNDTDIDGDALQVTQVTQGARGSVVINADGTVTYKPLTNFSGTDTFTYKVSDGKLSSNWATVTITVSGVNHAPVACLQVFTTNEDTVLNGVLKAQDVDGDKLTYRLIGGPLCGKVTVNSDGTFSYKPAANFKGLDFFTFKANDGKLDSNVGLVTICVKPVNDAPTAINDCFSTPAATPILGNVLCNDTDPDCDDLKAVLVSNPAHGTVQMGSNGTFLYTPAIGFSGTDTFTYKANDGSLNSNVATVTITVVKPATTANRKITGGGYIAGKQGGRANFNLNVKSSSTGSTIDGKLDYGDSCANVYIRSTSITGMVVNGNKARIFGKATLNGAGSYDFVIDVVDDGEPSYDDVYTIRLSNGFSNGPKNVDGGNIQIHK